VNALIGMIAAAVVCAAGAEGPSPAVRKKVLANHDPQHVVAVWRKANEHAESTGPMCWSDLGPTEGEDVCAEWHKRFGPSLEAMHQYLSESLSEQRWAQRSRPPSDGIDLEERAQRARRMLDGVAPVPDVHYLAAFDPRYDDDPLAEMEQGVTRAFPRDGSGAADGLSFVVTAPLSWLPGHARGDGTIMRLVSEAGAGLASLTIKVVPLAQDEEIPSAAALRKRALDSAVYPNREFVRDKYAQALGEHGSACVFYDRDESRYGVTRSINKHFQFVFERRVVRFEFAVLDRARSADDLLAMDVLETEFNRLEPLFDEIVSRASVAPER